MINHVYSTLYNLTAVPPSNVVVGLSGLLSVPDVLLGVTKALAGNTAGERDIFAIRCLKILDASSYRLELTKHDSRVTYDLHDLELDDINLQPFLANWLSLGPTIINDLINVRQDLRKTYLTSRITQESVTALIVSYVDKITEYNV